MTVVRRGLAALVAPLVAVIVAVVVTSLVVIAVGGSAGDFWSVILVKPADRSVREGDHVRLTLSAADPDGDALTFTSTALPGGAFLDPRTGVFDWTPAFFQHGTFDVPLKTQPRMNGAGSMSSYSSMG